ncbi:MAG: hypothetical protein Kow0065_14780 [Methylomicrobium sp.]
MYQFAGRGKVDLAELGIPDRTAIFGIGASQYGGAFRPIALQISVFLKPSPQLSPNGGCRKK